MLTQFTTLAAGRHVYNFTFALPDNLRLPPSVSFYQEVKGHGLLDLKCQYKVGAIIYDNTSSRMDKLEKAEFPILIKESIGKNQRRENFIEMGQSEVISCLGGMGSGGICSFQVKCVKDVLLDDEACKIQAKIDNSRCKQAVTKVDVRFIRYIRLHSL